MTRADLRHSAWNYGQLSAAAEMNAMTATTERERDAWNNVTLHLLNCVEEIERLLAADEPMLPFMQWVTPVVARPMRVGGGMAGGAL
jgi:hypothetical protein